MNVTSRMIELFLEVAEGSILSVEDLLESLSQKEDLEVHEALG